MIIKRPIITEKSLDLASRGWYTFLIDKKAQKREIAKVVAEMYHVNVIQVRTVSSHGKVRRTGKKMVAFRKPDGKKAMVQLKKGQKIDAFEVTAKEPEKPADAKAKAGKVGK